MSTEHVDFMELLHRLAAQNGWAVLLSAVHSPAGFAEPSRTELKNLDVVKPNRHGANRRRRLISGELVFRCALEKVDHDLEAAAEILVDLLTHAREQAA